MYTVDNNWTMSCSSTCQHLDLSKASVRGHKRISPPVSCSVTTPVLWKPNQGRKLWFQSSTTWAKHSMCMDLLCLQSCRRVKKLSSHNQALADSVCLLQGTPLFVLVSGICFNRRRKEGKSGQWRGQTTESRAFSSLRTWARQKCTQGRCNAGGRPACP